MYRAIIGGAVNLAAGGLLGIFFGRLFAPMLEFITTAEHSPPVPVFAWLSAAANNWTLMATIGALTLVLGRAVVENQLAGGI